MKCLLFICILISFSFQSSAQNDDRKKKCELKLPDKSLKKIYLYSNDKGVSLKKAQKAVKSNEYGKKDYQKQTRFFTTFNAEANIQFAKFRYGNNKGGNKTSSAYFFGPGYSIDIFFYDNLYIGVDGGVYGSIQSLGESFIQMKGFGWSEAFRIGFVTKHENPSHIKYRLFTGIEGLHVPGNITKKYHQPFISSGMGFGFRWFKIDLNAGFWPSKNTGFKYFTGASLLYYY